MASNITCPSCKKQIAVRYQVNRYVGCSNCQALLHINRSGVSEISRKRSSSLNGSDLQLGDKVKLEGKVFYVVGQFRYTEQIKEFDREECRYYTSPWTSDEWYLMSDELLSAWLCTDSEGLYTVSYFTPASPMLPDKDHYFTLDGGPSMFRAKEYGTRTLRAFIGEFPTRPNREKVVNFAMYEKNGVDVEVEWADKNGKLEWVSFNRSMKVSWIDQKLMFSANDPNSKKNRSLRLFDTRKFAIYLLVITALICSLGAGVTSGDGEELFAFAKNYSLSDPESWVFTTPPFEFKEVGNIYSLEVNSSFGPTDNSDLEFAIKIMDVETKKIVNVVAGEFYRESGRDSEGYWTEVDAGDTKLFKIEKPGNYFAEVTIYNTSTADSGMFYIRIAEQLLSRYYVAGLVISLVLLYILFKANSKGK